MAPFAVSGHQKTRAGDSDSGACLLRDRWSWDRYGERLLDERGNRADSGPEPLRPAGRRRFAGVWTELSPRKRTQPGPLTRVFVWIQIVAIAGFPASSSHAAHRDATCYATGAKR